jgi:putative oxidoreductase
MTSAKLANRSLLELMMKKLEDTGLLVARILMPILFIVAGYGKMGDAYAGTQQYMQAMGVPGFLLPLTILLEFGGGLAILFGFLTRTTALFTAGFTILTALLFHTNFAEGVNQLMFLKNLTITGGFILLAITGPGAFSIDRALNKKW